jgi:hypothetical protein
MKKIESVILSAIIITLIIGSAQVATAEKFNVDPDLNLRYEVYLQSVVRDAQGQLLSVSESTVGWVLITSFPDSVQITNFVGILFDNNVIAEKKIVTIDNVKYEKIQFQTEKVVDHRMLTSLGTAKVGMSSGTLWKFCGDFKGEYGHQCIPTFKAKTPQIHIAEGNVLTNQWTVLRVMN